MSCTTRTSSNYMSEYIIGYGNCLWRRWFISSPTIRGTEKQHQIPLPHAHNRETTQTSTNGLVFANNQLLALAVESGSVLLTEVHHVQAMVCRCECSCPGSCPDRRRCQSRPGSACELHLS